VYKPANERRVLSSRYSRILFLVRIRFDLDSRLRALIYKKNFLGLSRIKGWGLTLAEVIFLSENHPATSLTPTNHFVLTISHLSTQISLILNTNLQLMNSLSAISSTPLRVAARPQPYVFLIARAYSGAAVTSYPGCCRLNKRPSPVTRTPKRFISSTHQNQTKEFFPPPHTPGVKEVDSAWNHPV